MAFNREKTMANAQKHLRAGKVDKAIKEFERILEEDPSDVRSKLKMADLYVKGERFAEALHAYNDVAYAYAREDLYEKAAAVYKQAMRISPEDPALYTQLGEAYFRLGRLKDAVRVFHKSQKIYKRDGDVAAQRDILERMVRIDPEDVGLQIQLAERYEKDGLRDQAQHLFQEAAVQLKEEGRLDEFVQVAERMIFLAPNELERRKEVVRIYLGRGDEKHALKHLQYCFKVNPQDIETLELLGSTFHRLGADDKAVLVYAELAALYERNGLMDRAGSAYRTILSIDPSHSESRRFLGQAAPAPTATPVAPPRAEPVQTRQPEPEVYELDMDEFEEEDALDGIEFLDDDDDEVDEVIEDFATDEGQANGFLAFAEDAIRDLEPEADLNGIEAYPEVVLGGEHTAAVEVSESSLELVQVPEADSQAESIEFEGDEQIKQFLTESDVFLKYGLLDRAEEAITKVLALAPDNLGGREQMRKLLIKTGDKRGAAHQLVEMARITRHADERRSSQFLSQAAEMVDEDTLRTLARGAGLESDLIDVEVAPGFITEVSEGLEEISSTVQADFPEVGSHTIDLPDVDDLDDSMEDYGLSGQSAVEDDAALSMLQSAPNDGTMEDFNIDDFAAGFGDSEVDLTDIPFDDVGEMSFGDADDVDLDIDNINFDESALKALDTVIGDGELDLNFSAEDADLMFDELFGGAGGLFGDSEEDGVDSLDLDGGVGDDDMSSSEMPPSAFGARSLTSKFAGPATNPSIEIPGGVDINNSSLELGKTYKDMGLFSEAIEEFRHAMEDPDAAPAALYNIALCHIELGEKDDAHSHLTQLTEDESAPARWRDVATEKLNELTA